MSPPVVLITGALTGIGRATALAFAHGGAEIIVSGRGDKEGNDKERKPTGEYRYDGNVANRALELLGKQQGLFIDRHEVGQPNEFANWTDEELKAFIKSGTKPLGIVSGKTQH